MGECASRLVGFRQDCLSGQRWHTMTNMTENGHAEDELTRWGEDDDPEVLAGDWADDDLGAQDA